MRTNLPTWYQLVWSAVIEHAQAEWPAKGRSCDDPTYTHGNMIQITNSKRLFWVSSTIYFYLYTSSHHLVNGEKTTDSEKDKTCIDISWGDGKNLELRIEKDSLFEYM